jgi:hypothetical protein
MSLVAGTDKDRRTVPAREGSKVTLTGAIAVDKGGSSMKVKSSKRKLEPELPRIELFNRSESVLKVLSEFDEVLHTTGTDIYCDVFKNEIFFIIGFPVEVIF